MSVLEVRQEPRNSKVLPQRCKPNASVAESLLVKGEILSDSLLTSEPLQPSLAQEISVLIVHRVGSGSGVIVYEYE